MPTEKLALFGKYEILAELGRGGFGRVLKARHRFLPRTVALKQLAPGTLASDEDIERFRREAAAMEQLRHEHIVNVYDAGIEGGFPYLAMEFVEGRNLEEILRQDGPLAVEEALQMGREMASALAHMHAEGLIHRDVKAANILRRAADGRFFLTDFGIVHQTDSARITHGPIGTPEYMSPEQIDGHTVVQSDLYSLGVVVFEALTGRVPFPADGTSMTARARLLGRILSEPAPAVASLRPEVPAWFDAVLARCLAKRPEDRFESGAALRQALRADADAPPGAAPPEDSGVSASQMMEYMKELEQKLERENAKSRQREEELRREQEQSQQREEALRARLDEEARQQEEARQKAARRAPAPDAPPVVLPVREGATRPLAPRRALMGLGVLAALLLAVWFFWPGGGAPVPAPAETPPGDYPEASMRPLTPADLEPLSLRELEIMRNEIFARHGYIFTSPEWQRHFGIYAWYTPESDDVSDLLTPIEDANIERIQAREKHIKGFDPR